MKETHALIRIPVFPKKYIDALLRSENPLALLNEQRKLPEVISLIRKSSNAFGIELEKYVDSKDAPLPILVSLYSYLSRLSMRCTPLGATTSVNELPFAALTLLSEDSDKKKVLISRPDLKKSSDEIILSARAVIVGSVIFYSRLNPGSTLVTELRRELDSENIRVLNSFIQRKSRGEHLRELARKDPEVVLREKQMIRFWMEESVLIYCEDEEVPELFHENQILKTMDFNKYLETKELEADTHFSLLTRDLSQMSLGKREVDLVKKAANIVRTCFADKNRNNMNNRFLQHFANDFYQRYGEGLVPLAEALNPSLALGFSTQMEVPPPRKLEEFLLNKWDDIQSTGKGVWEITPAEIGELSSIQELAPAETLSGETVFGSILEKNGRQIFYFKSVISGLPTIGLTRFDAFGLIREGLVQELVDREIKDAPTDTIFAEIQVKSSRDRRELRRRRVCTDYVITVDVAPTSGATEIPFRDLRLFWRSGRMHLYSVSLNKIVIPIISHIQQFVLDDNRVMRLLGAIALQDRPLMTGWYWGIPGKRTRFPRVQYGDIIFMPQCWTFRRDSFVEHAFDSEFRKRHGLPDSVILVEDGKELFINFQHEELCRKLFNKFQGEEVMIYENLYNEFQSSVSLESDTFMNEVQVVLTKPVTHRSSPGIPLPVKVQNSGENFLSVHVTLPTVLRFDVLPDLIQNQKGFYIFYGDQKGLTEIRLRLRGEHMLEQELPKLFAKLQGLRDERRIVSYNASYYEPDDHYFTCLEARRLLPLFHEFHSRDMLNTLTFPVKEIDIYFRFISLLLTIQRALLVSVRSEGPSQPRTRRLMKALQKKFHSGPVEKIEFPDGFFEELKSIEDSERELFFRRIVHLGNLRISPVANHDMDKALFTLLQEFSKSFLTD